MLRIARVEDNPSPEVLRCVYQFPFSAVSVSFMFLLPYRVVSIFLTLGPPTMFNGIITMCLVYDGFIFINSLFRNPLL